MGDGSIFNKKKIKKPINALQQTVTADVEKDKIEISVETISVFKDIPEKNFSSIPDCCGAYVIKVQSGKRYVGSSKTLRTRIQSHKVYNDPNITEPIISVCYYQTENHMDGS